ncbi:metabotropic glutamate receptor 2-like protein [Leptotrombidium deliense]|uniref:Metabotropic glutamate receptor 2-like protein n=1 Tax=Leptotrombidium deliense TaxID=299467 RepID=A0A443RZW3_9ACAR|nr:metabotropic glutamate receptor 2-like protein [Leptotrombidium deliense]
MELSFEMGFNLQIVSVFNAVYAFAFGLRKAWEFKCRGKAGLCDDLRSISPQEVFRGYVLSVKFDGLNGENFQFHDNEQAVFLPITQYQNYLGTYRFKPVGTWHFMGFDNFKPRYCEPVQLPSCTPFCENGFRKVEDESSSCCWNCVQCAIDEIVVNEINCNRCDDRLMPDFNKTDCVPINLSFVNANLNEKFDKLNYRISQLQYALSPREFSRPDCKV